MSTTFQNSAMVLSIGIFFSLMITGLARTLPHTLSAGLIAQGVPADAAAKVAQLPPVGVLFASLLGYNPVQTLLGPQVLSQLPAANAHYLTGRSFFPSLISGPFADGLGVAFAFAIAACVIAAIASALRGGKYVHVESAAPTDTRQFAPAQQLSPAQGVDDGSREVIDGVLPGGMENASHPQRLRARTGGGNDVAEQSGG